MGSYLHCLRIPNIVNLNLTVAGNTLVWALLGPIWDLFRGSFRPHFGVLDDLGHMGGVTVRNTWSSGPPLPPSLNWISTR